MQTTLPQGVTADNVQFRQATFIETSIGNVERVLVEALLVVAVVLFLFLLNLRATAHLADRHPDLGPDHGAGLQVPSACRSTP